MAFNPVNYSLPSPVTEIFHANVGNTKNLRSETSDPCLFLAWLVLLLLNNYLFKLKTVLLFTFILITDTFPNRRVPKNRMTCFKFRNEILIKCLWSKAKKTTIFYNGNLFKTHWSCLSPLKLSWSLRLIFATATGAIAISILFSYRRNLPSLKYFCGACLHHWETKPTAGNWRSCPVRDRLTPRPHLFDTESFKPVGEILKCHHSKKPLR